MKQKLNWAIGILVVLLVVVVGYRWRTSVNYDENGNTSVVSQTATDTQKISVHVVVQNDSYTAIVAASSTVIDVMDTLTKTSSFRYSGKTYPELGVFVEEINGIHNSRDAFWSLYVNDTVSPVGPSSYSVQANDRIEWKFEKIKS